MGSRYPPPVGKVFWVCCQSVKPFPSVGGAGGLGPPVLRTLRVVGAITRPRGAAPPGPADSGGGARLSLKKVGGKNTRGKPLDPGFLWPLVPTRWILRWLCLDRSQGCYFRHTNPDLERIFREEYAEKHFCERWTAKQPTTASRCESLPLGGKVPQCAHWGG